MVNEMFDKSDILKALQDVKDPEIPTISIVDLGIVTDVTINNGSVSVKLTPTFAGCPALKVMESMVEERIKNMGIENVEVITDFSVQWTTDMITENGLRALKAHGLAPPPRLGNKPVQIELLDKVICPLCGSSDTELKTPFGPTLCRSIHYCKNCLNAFEQFKPVG